VLIQLILVFFMIILSGCTILKKNHVEADNRQKSYSHENLFKNVKLVEGYKKIGNTNPLITQRFSADPFAMEYNGRVYVYSTNDILEYDSSGKLIENNYSTIKTLNVISSDDLVNWTDHGTIKVAGPGGAASWASHSWAPTATHKKVNGRDKFFLYFANNGSGIGVLTSDSPIGPWIDPIERPLITRQTENCAGVPWIFDPAVFIDDDGKAYLYFGGGVPEGKDENPESARVVELGEDMISLAGTPVVINAPYFFEAAYMNKINDTYYYSYCSNWSSRDNTVGEYKPEIAEIIYMTSNSPLGPWTYKGSILKNPGVFFQTYGNNHHSLIKFQEKWYIFYHSQILSRAMKLSAGGHRSIHVDEVNILEDGTIEPVIATYAGAKQAKYLDPFILNEAETFAWMGGVSTSESAEKSLTYGETNLVISDIETGSWIGISKVDFGTIGSTSFTAKVSSAVSGNVIKICLDSPDGEAIGYLNVPKTGSVDTYMSVTAEIKKTEGVHNLFFVFAGKEFQFDSWRFDKSK
jgi:arabinoxylan arabinofuranohydrolase